MVSIIIKHFMFKINLSSQHHSEVDNIILILQIRKLRYREAK